MTTAVFTLWDEIKERYKHNTIIDILDILRYIQDIIKHNDKTNN